MHQLKRWGVSSGSSSLALMVGLFMADWRLSGGSMRNIAERKPQTDPEADARATVSHIQTTKKGPVFQRKPIRSEKKVCFCSCFFDFLREQKQRTRAYCSYLSRSSEVEPF